MFLFICISSFIYFITISMFLFKSPINSTLSLAGSLLLSIILLFLTKIEFLSYVFILVYVGGIVLLFLFVIIMLNLRVDVIKRSDYRLLSGSSIFIFFIVLKLQSIVFCWVLDFVSMLERNYYLFEHNNIFWNLTSNNDILTIGLVLYTQYSFYFVLVGIVLLAAMLGVLVITLNSKKKC